jgi:hypothetical protein
VPVIKNAAVEAGDNDLGPDLQTLEVSTQVSVFRILSEFPHHIDNPT